ncbi:MAG: DNA mismatch repair protein MutS [Bacillota bacterium]
MENLTPMMRQYMELKEQYKDCILLFRLGDFYEMFFEDAITASKELEITLTGRDCGLEERAPMCGVPHHSIEGYIAKLIDRGYKVAIGEQVEDPSQAKGIVKRDVVRIITPGTVIDPHMLQERENNYIMAVSCFEDEVGLAFADISTGELRTTQIKSKDAVSALIDEIAKVQPKEIIIHQDMIKAEKLLHKIHMVTKAFVNEFDSWAFKKDFAEKKLKKHFHVLNLTGFDLEDKDFCISTTGALLEYLQQTQKNSLSHINRVVYYNTQEYMVIDKATRRNLELTETMRDKNRKGSLLWGIDKTQTAMGARMIKKWIEEPLTNVEAIQMRLDAVGELKEDIIAREELKELLRQVYDLERLAGRVAYGNANARDLIALKTSIHTIPIIRETLNALNSKAYKELLQQIDTLSDIEETIESAIVDEPPVSIKEGNIIKSTFSEELRELRDITINGKAWIANLENKEKQATGIKSLKVGFNKVFGYFIEVTKSNLNLVPDYFIRKQTLANAERFITPELKEMESKILGAEDRIVELEYNLFIRIREEISLHIKRIQSTASAIAGLDALLSFSEVSSRYSYQKPVVHNNHVIKILNGRHPVVERSMQKDLFIPNDTYLDCDDNRFAIITGPNMAGKSTYMRQVALIVLLAQIGCFVPADEAEIGIVDRIFTRVGASDDLAQGQSTFMLEMSELANILNNATEKSLIILDEIGRGTSTYDGLSIAWAVVEHISHKNILGARTLFATHYHELTELEGIIEGVKNYCISVKEKGDDIIFLRKIIRGGADQSYGIQVARLAGVEEKVIQRAKQILHQLEEHDINKTPVAAVQDRKDEKAITEEQIDIFHYNYQHIIDALTDIDIMNLTPMEAMNQLYKFVKMAKDCR